MVQSSLQPVAKPTALRDAGNSSRADAAWFSWWAWWHADGNGTMIADRAGSVAGREALTGTTR
ncbi:hypothetical protein J8F10_01910 [Gemmata sp. G18]|uniref:Uncharacterized protein n=1 Tax=Gemmata palustris TaxID=2822762 RepID=A0ABS5BK31_9BACT|nr:hypothetical protein [Gemmata palustris]MBP3954053.1 hypothetical protein [Gemmata palustris]